jgi:hypothetical protein
MESENWAYTELMLTKVYIQYLIGTISKHGPIDQLGRSPALQAGGHGFKSRWVHTSFLHGYIKAKYLYQDTYCTGA